MSTPTIATTTATGEASSAFLSENAAATNTNTGTDPTTSKSTDYGKWNRLAEELVEESEAQDEAEKRAASESLGQTKVAYSQAEKNEQLKSEAARKAKQALDAQKEREEAQVVVLGPELLNSGEEVRVVPEMLDRKRVVCLRGIQGPGTIILDSQLSKLHFETTVEDSKDQPQSVKVWGLIKVFVENCSNLKIILEKGVKIVTGTLELSHCREVHLQATECDRLATLQLDLCSLLRIDLGEGVVWGRDEQDRIYHAGVSDSQIRLFQGKVLRAETRVDYLQDGAAAVGNATAEEDQFVTLCRCDKKGGTPTLHTEKVVRIGTKTLLQSEVEKETLEKANKFSQHSWRDQERAKQCREKKAQGNEAFAAGEYAQAVLLYSMAMDTSEGLPRELFDEGHILLANRSACFLKLGELDKALEDASQCVERNPDYIKGHFRKGVALHALGRYEEAVPVLGKCHQMEPANKQVTQALQFAQVRLEQEMRKRMERS